MQVYNGMEQVELIIVEIDFYIEFWVVHQLQFWRFSFVKWKVFHCWKSYLPQIFPYFVEE